MKKYWHVFEIGIQNTLVYRVNFFFRAFFNLIPLLAAIVLWQAIFDGKGGEVAGYTLAQMITYYVIVMVVENLTVVTEDDWQIAADIKDGLISQFMIKPIDYLHYRLCLFASGRLVYTLAAIAPVALLVFFYRDYLVWPADWQTALCFLCALVMSALIQFLLSYVVALLSFWVLEISTFVFILLAFERIASGQMFPLDVLPPVLGAILWLTPFPYMMFVPVSIYMGKLTGLAMIQALAMQALWLAVCYALARWVWKRGVKSYGAVGG